MKYIMILFVLASVATGTTWYVDDDSAGGDGTTAGLSGATAAFTELEDAITKVEDSTIGQGDTINVAAGTYSFVTHYENTVDTGRSAYINVVGDSSSYPIVTGMGIASTHNAYMSYQYLHFGTDPVSPQASEPSVVIKNDFEGDGTKNTSYVKFNDCIFEVTDLVNSYSGSGIKLHWSENVSFTDCIFDGGLVGILLVENNYDTTFTTCTIQDTWGDCIRIYPGTFASGFVAETVTIDGCILEGGVAIYDVTLPSFHMDMIDLGGVINDLIIKNCIASGAYNHTWQSWTGFHTGTGWEYGVYDDGIFHYSIIQDQSEGVNFTFENNLLYGPCNIAPRFDGSIRENIGRTGLIVRNNTMAVAVYNEGPGTLQGYIKTGDIASINYNNIWGFANLLVVYKSLDNNTDQNNNIYDNYDSGNSNTAIGESSSEISITELKALFVDFDGDNLRLVIDSLAIGFGDTANAPATDIEGTSRATPPNAGAYAGAFSSAGRYGGTFRNYRRSRYK